MTTIENVLFAILLTIVLEFPVYWLFVREKPLYLLEVSSAINLATVPMANLVFAYAPGWFVPIEIGVMLVEAPPIHWLLRQDYGKALLISIMANGLSALVGILLWLV